MSLNYQILQTKVAEAFMKYAKYMKRKLKSSHIFKGAEKYKVKVFKQASKTISQLKPSDFQRYLDRRSFQSLDGIGPSCDKAIYEIVHQDTIRDMNINELSQFVKTKTASTKCISEYEEEEEKPMAVVMAYEVLTLYEDNCKLREEVEMLKISRSMA